jgi:DNA-binding NtrC family response regulator
MYMNPVLSYREKRQPERRTNINAEPSAVIDNKLEALKMLASSMLTEVVSLEQNRGGVTNVKLDLSEEVRRLEIDLIRCALIRTGGRQRQAARLLNVKPTTLHEKMKRYGILQIEPNTVSLASREFGHSHEAVDLDVELS